jgi:hypothetical protein
MTPEISPYEAQVFFTVIAPGVSNEKFHYWRASSRLKGGPSPTELADIAAYRARVSKAARWAAGYD